MIITGLPKVKLNKDMPRFGKYICKCKTYFGCGETRAIAFAEWQKLSKAKGK